MVIGRIQILEKKCAFLCAAFLLNLPCNRKPKHYWKICLYLGFHPALHPGGACIISDENTHYVLGQTIAAQLPKAKTIILPHGVKASLTQAEDLAEQARDSDFIIAVGSGTINDLSQYAAYLRRIPYVIFGTAPSMNGYASANASLLYDGVKQSFPALLPHAIILDLDILTQAPMRLIQSGVGDSLCRPTAQADWLLSHLIHDNPYADAPFALLKESEATLLTSLDGIMQRDMHAIKTLAELLILSGLGMYLAKGSYPASQGEHSLAHFMELKAMELRGHNGEYFHGEEIAVTTLTMARLQEKLVGKALLTGYRKEWKDIKQDIKTHMPKALVSSCLKANKNKLIDKAKAQFLRTHWHFIKEDLRSIMIPSKTLEAYMQQVGLATTLQDIGWNSRDYAKAKAYSCYLRDRFTFLDIAGDSMFKRYVGADQCVRPLSL